ncbi:hypothetical protein NL676_022169 [Syzygium grande]|nr:hypothetical protein NL676_022169 [Syzygium grande]
MLIRTRGMHRRPPPKSRPVEMDYEPITLLDFIEVNIKDEAAGKVSPPPPKRPLSPYLARASVWIILIVIGRIRIAHKDLDDSKPSAVPVPHPAIIGISVASVAAGLVPQSSLGARNRIVPPSGEGEGEGSNGLSDFGSFL